MPDPEQSIFAPKTERQPLTFEQAYADGLEDDADLDEMVMKSEGVKPVDTTDLTGQGQDALRLESEARQAADEARAEIENIKFFNPNMPLSHSLEATPSYVPPVSVDRMPPIAPEPRTDGFKEGVHMGKIQVVDPHTPAKKKPFWST
jgi:hypothetical protein